MNVGYPEIPNGTGLTDRELSSQWKSIDWSTVRKTVNNLQSRLARAAKKRNWFKIRKLIRLLTRSYHAKLLAVKTVTDNKGGKTPGIDGILWTSAADKMKAASSLTGKGYKAKPLKRVYIPKKNGKMRPLSIPTLYDRAMQTLYALAMSPIEVSTGDLASFGFRNFRSTKDAYAYMHICLSRKCSAEYILEGDIKSCFDMISHDWLLNNIPIKRLILTQFLKAGYFENGRVFPTDSGTPQGGSLSPILANMVLNGMEAELGRVFYSQKDGKINKKCCNKHKVNFIRYADDFVVTADSVEVLLEAKEIITRFLEIRGLTLSDEKTIITHIFEGFDLLGWNFRKYNGKLLPKPSKRSQESIILKIREIIHKGRTWSQDRLIANLNPIIRGWTLYHKHAVSSAVFSRLDHIVWCMLYAWAKRRHQNKGKKWIAHRYWHKIRNRTWTFASSKLKLISFSNTKIERYRMARLNKNPYIDRGYFEEWRERRRKFFPPTQQTTLMQFLG
ncbi:MAG: group II intron reverse transcriptase/maturase [Deltaproteobacteria bacterium]|nr:group II intron reverse transcriptase/maturase [Deltaproteobacteria bacterium]